MDRFVLAMGITRLLYAFFNLAAAVIIWKLNDVGGAMRVNAILGGFMGPIVFLSVSALGVVGLSQRIAPTGMILVFVGVLLILWGIRS